MPSNKSPHSLIRTFFKPVGGDHVDELSYQLEFCEELYEGWDLDYFDEFENTFYFINSLHPEQDYPLYFMDDRSGIHMALQNGFKGSATYGYEGLKALVCQVASRKAVGPLWHGLYEACSQTQLKELAAND